MPCRCSREPRLAVGQELARVVVVRASVGVESAWAAVAGAAVASRPVAMREAAGSDCRP